MPAAELEARTYAMARTITTRSPAAIAASKEAIRVLSEAVAINPGTYEYLHGLRRSVYMGRTMMKESRHSSRSVLRNSERGWFTQRR